jgi:predicted RNA-binding protein
LTIIRSDFSRVVHPLLYSEYEYILFTTWGGKIMCEITACILKDNREEKVLEAVEHVQATENEVTLVNLFGEKITINARFKSYNANNNKMIFESP